MLTFDPVTERVLPIAHDTELLLPSPLCLILGHHNDAVLVELLSLVGPLNERDFDVLKSEVSDGVPVRISRDNRVVLPHDFILNLAYRCVRQHLGQQDVIPFLLLAAYHYTTAALTA